MGVFIDAPRSRYDALVDRVVGGLRGKRTVIAARREPKLNAAQNRSLRALMRRMQAEATRRKPARRKVRAVGARGQKKSGWAKWKAKGGGRGRRAVKRRKR